ncbi:hypothetical protein BGZ70_009099 [Mortierella alpina]|uniref:Uncharacterized protein n=1 Tax=Mortierella alpina TaxID=64518 RepID=A0A9P6M6I5_MORAP|nr:hypothetical protein BGZ70_009099 [Mortierella alpina]
MGPAETISTHTVKNDATTTIVTRTTTIVSEHEEVLAEPKEHGHSVVENVRQTLRDYWFPSHASEDEDEDDELEEPEPHQDPSLFRGNSVMRRAYDYWKTLTQDADQAAKDMVIQAKRARDEAAIEAKWAFLGYKKEAREAYEEADKKYREALAFAEKVHEEAHEKAKSKWFQAVDTTEKEVGEIKDQASEVTHKKWDQFKSAVNSMAFNPPKYGCSPSSQYWFSRQNPAADSGWDCREIWDHPSRHDHRHHAIKTLPKKHLSIDRVHDTLTSLFTQAGHKARNAPSATSFETHLKPVRDQYHRALDLDKIKAKLNEAKYFEEQTDAWLTSQWNAVIDNAGDTKDQYERVFKNALKSIKNTRTDIYNTLLNSLQRNINSARNNINEAVRATKNQADKSRVHKAVQDASDSFSSAVKEAEVKIKAAPKHAYDHALDTFHRDTAQLKAKLEKAASTASKSGDAKNFVDEAQRSASSKYQEAADKARSGYEHATASASSLWGSATPHSTLHKVQHSYHTAIGNVHSHWFGDHVDNEMSVSSVYGALLAIYFLFLANRIWRSRRLSRMADPSEKTFNVVKNGHAGDTVGSNKHPNGDSATATIETYKRKSSAEEALEKERNSFGTVLVQFTSVVPVTLILLVLLELAGFSRVALHTLFVGLVTSQVLQGGLLNNILTQMGIVDGVHASGRDIGTYLSWAVLGLAAVANAIKVLHN